MPFAPEGGKSAAVNRGNDVLGERRSRGTISFFLDPTVEEASGTGHRHSGQGEKSETHHGDRGQRYDSALSGLVERLLSSNRRVETDCI